MFQILGGEQNKRTPHLTKTLNHVHWGNMNMCKCYCVRSRGIVLNMWNMFCDIFDKPSVTVKTFPISSLLILWKQIHSVTGLSWLFCISVSLLYHPSFIHFRTMCGYCHCFVSLHFPFCHLSFQNTCPLCVAVCSFHTISTFKCYFISRTVQMWLFFSVVSNCYCFSCNWRLFVNTTVLVFFSEIIMVTLYLFFNFWWHRQYYVTQA